MARSGNLNEAGSVRVELIGGPDVQFLAGTNSGLFDSIVRNGIGDYTITYARPLSAGDVSDYQVEGAAEGFAVPNRLTNTTEQVRVFNDAATPVALDAALAVLVTEQFLG